MQLIFKYDIDRLQSYSTNYKNNIHIADKSSFMMLSFPEVDYFNYAFTRTNQTLHEDQLNEIESFYLDKQILKHKIIVNSNCIESNELLKNHAGYQYVSAIAKTAISPGPDYITPLQDELHFIKADHRNIDKFADLYLQGFESEKKPDERIVNNFKSLLNLKDLDLFLIRNEDKYVGVNVLYQSKTETLLAGGAILPEHRNKGFHQQGLKFRINQAIKNNSKNIIAWAYNPSISLKNMLKLNMKVQETFNVYEYCR